MANPDNVEWEICAEGECLGVRLPTGGKCWAHAAQPHLNQALKRLGEDGRLNARGVPITQELLRRLLAAAPPDDHGHATLTEARFDKATFNGDALFDSATFRGAAWFAGATFRGAAGFAGATFTGAAGFRGATFQGDARFEGATFPGGAPFSGATFQGDAVFRGAILRGAGFGGATFHSGAWFGGANFWRGAGFRRVTFHSDAWFDGATFPSDAWFGEATFQGDARFDRTTFNTAAGFRGAIFQSDARFDGATFQQARQLGPLLMAKSLRLDQAVFHERAQIEVAAAVVSCWRARFLGGVQLRVRWAQVVLDDADLAAPSILTGSPPFANLDEQPFVAGWRQAPRPPRPDGQPPDGQPWVASLRRADLAGLTLSNADLQACRFAGAHNLDRLRLESLKAFASAPGWKAVESGWAWPPLWWWTRRHVLAEELAWRAKYERGIRRAGWHPGKTWPPGSSHWVASRPGLRRQPGRRGQQVARMLRDARRRPRRLALLRRLRAAHTEQRREEAREIANLYRALRKGREDNKDEPGAADFYYGEMELRRKARPPSVERLILGVYWLVSGYGLRAWRAITATLVALAVFAVLMVTVGFQHPASSQPARAAMGPAIATTPVATTEAPETSFAGAVLYCARTAIGLTRTPQPALTRWGDGLQIAVRITVPVLLGLAVLSIRGRVRR
jgi:uncharacterized protein YjbI with pentapeptide repeats